MEAVPRLPMVSFDLKVSTENVSFGPQLKQYIASFYNEDPESYNVEIGNLESLRGAAVRPSTDVSGCQLLKKYYCQLHFLKSRFPMSELQAAAVYFSWKDTYSSMACSVPDVRFELMCILHNIGALHSKLGSSDSRTSPDGMKMACTHFQCAAWAFQTIKEQYYQMVSYVSSIEVVHFTQQVCLAQAQECILEKSMMDNRKATIIAKVAVQVVDYYKRALMTIQSGGDESSFNDFVRSKTLKEWEKYLSFKVSYHKCIALLFQGQQAEEQQKMGERVAFYQAACDQLEEARKLSTNLKQQKEIAEALAFTSDVVEGKRKAAKNENEFIYHEEVPEKEALQEVKGASLVKGIPFNVNDVEVSGPDIFARLVPMEAHEASSLYSEKKAQMLRQMAELVEIKDQMLAEFMSSMQLEVINQMHQATGLPQELVDRAAALSAKPTVCQDLVSAMGKLSNSYHEVESMLSEIADLLKEEEQSEKEYQELMGKRPPSIIATDLAREAAKYREAHNKANDSNQNLHKAMTTHVANLKILSQPLLQLQQQIPAVELPNPNVDDEALKELEILIAKVEEMRTQRAMLWTQFREAVHEDDITNVLVTRQADQPLDNLFQQELQKHQKLASFIEQNAVAQGNILKVFVEVYARSSNSRRYLQDVINKRSATVSALISSFDTYEDLLAKANKGIEFYNKLETNVSKLLQRIKSACKVQQEERDQMLLKNAPKEEQTPSAQLKLKDFLDSRKRISGNVNNTQYKNRYPSNLVQDQQVWPAGARPAPLGSEVNHDSTSTLNRQNEVYSNITQNKTDVDSSLTDGLAALRTNGKNDYYPYTQGVQNDYQINQASVGQDKPSTPTTTTTNSYQPISSVVSQYPTSSQYSDSNVSNNYYTGQYQNYSEQSMHYGQQKFYYGGDYRNYPTNNSVNTNFTTTPTYPVSAGGAGLNYQHGSYQPASQTYQSGAGTQLKSTGPDVASNLQIYSSSSGSQLNYPTDQNSAYKNVTQNYQPTINSQTTSATGEIYHQSDSGLSGYYQSKLNGNYQNYPVGANSNISTDSGIGQIYPTNSGTGGGVNYQTGQNTAYQTDYNPSLNVGSVQSSTSSTQIYQTNPASSLNYPTSGTYQSNTAPQSYQSAFNNSYQAGISGTYQGGTTGYPTNTNVTQYQVNVDGTIPTYQTSAISSLHYPAGYQTDTTQTYQTGLMSTSQTYQSQTEGVQPYPTATNYQYSTMNQQQYTDAYQTGTYYATPSISQYTNISSPTTNTTTTTTTTTPSKTPTPIVTTKESNVDLLSGLDFSISQAPLIPQQNTITQTNVENPQPTTELQPTKPKTTSTPSSIKDEPSRMPVINLKPLNNTEVKRIFTQEIDKFEKFVDVLSNKTLSGPTNLELKWKEIQDKQECDGVKKAISVARCYPIKNRSPDILPYDGTRVELKSTKDDYINASFVNDICLYGPPFIVTQAPLQSTFVDFWTMIREQQVEIIVCLLNTSEVDKDIYWPQGKGKDLHLSDMVVSLISENEKPNWIERLISISMPEKRDSRVVMHLQFTCWPGSLLPTTPEQFVNFVKEILGLYYQQRHPSHAIVVHCQSGIGRSGVACILMSAIMEVTNNPNAIPDLVVLASKLTAARKNILRDREHLKFAYEAFLFYMKEFVEGQTKKLNEYDASKKDAKPEEVKSETADPLSQLDPFWASKKGN